MTLNINRSKSIFLVQNKRKENKGNFKHGILFSVCESNQVVKHQLFSA
jgi:hypothetical protein